MPHHDFRHAGTGASSPCGLPACWPVPRCGHPSESGHRLPLYPVFGLLQNRIVAAAAMRLSSVSVVGKAIRLPRTAG